MAVEDDSAEAMFECILEWATETKNMELYEAQEEAIMELVEGNSVLLTTPTGSGKTLVATAAIAAATARGDVRTRESVRRLPGARIASEFRVRGCIHPRRDAYPSRLFAIAEPPSVPRNALSARREPNRHPPSRKKRRASDTFPVAFSKNASRKQKNRLPGTPPP
jgi:energy-coupling factor transporter ATP-binding protein EcfA2